MTGFVSCPCATPSKPPLVSSKAVALRIWEKAMIGMRNRLIHVYFDIDLEILWHTVEQALPELLQQIEAILTQETP